MCDGLPRAAWKDSQHRLIATFRRVGGTAGAREASPGADGSGASSSSKPADGGGAPRMTQRELLAVLVVLHLLDLVSRQLWRPLLEERPLQAEAMLRGLQVLLGLSLERWLAARRRLGARVALLRTEENVTARLRVERLPGRDSGLPPPARWPDRPVIARALPSCTDTVTPRAENPGVHPSAPLSPDPLSFCANVAPYDFETPLFKGSIMLRLKGLDNTPAEYFRGRNRRMQVVVQGRFKRRTPFSSVYSGQQFNMPLAWTPSRTVVRAAFAALSPVLPPTFRQDVFCDTPYFLSPLLCTCQGFAVERPGEEQNPFGQQEHRWSIQEDTRLLNDPDCPTNGDRRRKYFGVDANLLKHHFEPDLVYTFDYYQHYFDAIHMNLELSSLLSFDGTRILGRQALQLSMAKDTSSDDYIWCFDLLNESLLPGASA